ncbi:MAG: hypothetical protein K8S00_12935 [Bacteroidales bacterium]|nr:hypothetical protein [Bacteroidales bacterium]
MDQETYLKSLYFQHQDKKSIREINPNIDFIEVDIDYAKNNEYKIDNETTKIKADDSPPYHIKCRNWRCSKGYFDLTYAVYDLINNKNEYVIKKFTCDGKSKRTYHEVCGFKATCKLIRIKK